MIVLAPLIELVEIGVSTGSTSGVSDRFNESRWPPSCCCERACEGAAFRCVGAGVSRSALMANASICQYFVLTYGQTMTADSVNDPHAALRGLAAQASRHSGNGTAHRLRPDSSSRWRDRRLVRALYALAVLPRGFPCVVEEMAVEVGQV